MPKLLNLYALAVGFTAIIVVFATLINAMLHDGLHRLIHVNYFYEGYLEIAIFASGAVVFPAVILDAIKKPSR